MRICSLVPAATEILFALGLGDQVVGVTHECDWPPEARERPVVTASLVQTGDLSSSEIDAAVSEAAASGRPLYAIDADVWREVEADIVVAQELCEVCAVSRSGVDDAIALTKIDVGVIDYSPSTLEEVLDGIISLGSWLGADPAAAELVAGMRARVDRVRGALLGIERVRGALLGIERVPRIFISEWIEPPYSAGHWVPDMVAIAGGVDVAGMSGEPSHRMRWLDVAELDPDVVVLAPCGFDLDKTLGEVVTLDLSAHLLGTAARRDSRVFAVDGNAYFSRPGPRLADGIELLAYLLHPDAYSDPGIPWSRVRL